MSCFRSIWVVSGHAWSSLKGLRACSRVLYQEELGYSSVRLLFVVSPWSSFVLKKSSWWRALFFREKSALTECSPRASCCLEQRVGGSWVWFVRGTEIFSCCSLWAFIWVLWFLKNSGALFLAYPLVVCCLPGVAVWWRLSVNVACSQVVQCWHILRNMLVFEYCAWVFYYWVLFFHCVLCKACFIGTSSPCAPLLRSINTLPECLFSSIEHLESS